MHSDQKYQDTLLDIELLAVQIEQNNKIKKNQQASLYYDHLQQQKHQQYRQFKSRLTANIQQWGTLSTSLTALGIFATKSILLGAFTGLGITYGIKSYFYSQHSNTANTVSGN